MKKWPSLLMIPALIVLIVPSIVNAQMSTQVQNRFEREYKITEEVISRVRSAIAASGINKGTELLDQAENIQTRARNMGMERNFSGGITMTMSARERAKTAAMINQQAEENEYLVRRQLEKTDNLLERIRNGMSSDFGSKGESQFNAACENQQKAWEFYYNHSLRPALKLSRQVENSMKRLTERYKESEGQLNQVRNQLGKLEGKMERVGGLVEDCGNKKAEKMYAELKKQYETALRQMNQQEYDGLQNRLRIMNEQLNEIAEICQSAELQNQNLNRLRQEIEASFGPIQDSGNDQAIKLMEKAQKHLEKAERFCANNDTDNCAANMKAAQISLRKAKGIAGL